MARIKLDQATLQLSSFFSRITKTSVLDCFQLDDTIFFVVPNGDVGKAVGKGGMNVKNLQTKLNRKIRIVEHHDSIEKFVENMLSPIRVEKIELQDGVLIISDRSKKTKSLLIGRNGKNLNLLKRAVQRFFSVEVQVK